MQGKSFLSRLLLVQMACGLAVLVTSIVVLVIQTTRAEHGDLDRDLSLYARAMGAVLDDPEDVAKLSATDLDQVDEIAKEALGTGARRIGVQVLSNDGNLLYRSHDAPALALPPGKEGFEFVRADGDDWRILVSPQDAAEVVLIASERESERLYWAAKLAWKISLPLLWLLPSVILGSWLAARYAILPLRRVVSGIALRAPADLSPISISASFSEIQPVFDELNRLLARVEQARTSDRDFFAEAAHELKTPLAVTSAQAFLLKSAKNEGERKAAEAGLERSLHRTSHVVNQLLALAAVERQNNISELRPVDLSALLTERLASLAGKAHEASVDLSLDAEDAVIVLASLYDLTSIIDNLVDNAIRYNRPGGKVEVTLSSVDGRVSLTVVDDGHGIPLSERARVFDRFYRGKLALSTGSGLGLTIVRSAAFRLGGCVVLNPTISSCHLEQKGVSFSVHLPTHTLCAGNIHWPNSVASG